MKPFHGMGIGILAGAAGGFILAWQLKPVAGGAVMNPATPLRTRVERRTTTSHPVGEPAPSAFSHRWEELADDDDCEQKRESLLAALGADEFPQLLAEIICKAGFGGLDFGDNEQLEELFKVWHAKAPEAALAWLSTLPGFNDRRQLLEIIVEKAAETDLDTALLMLRLYGRDEVGDISIPSELLENAAAKGADKLLEVCKWAGQRNADQFHAPNIAAYPSDFDFKLVLDGLAAAEAEFGKDSGLSNFPGNLLSEWAKRDLQAAWAWLREGKTVSGNEMSSLIAVTSPTDAGALLGSAFDPAANDYLAAQSALFDKPSSEMLDAFLQAAPGDRAAHLDGLFSLGWSGDVDFDEFRSLILERMSPEQRVEVLRHKTKESRVNSKVWIALIRTLRALGHSEEEIEMLKPELKD